MSDPKVIILQTTPYNTSLSSRTLDAYFHYWDRNKVRQIYSRNMQPQKGHCSELYQITDSKLLNCWLHKISEPGIIYYYEDLKEQGLSQEINESGFITKSYKIGKKHTPTIELLRGMLWRKKYWCTEKLNSWLDDFQPELVFYNFTNNLFLQRIALYIADRFNIPIITAVGDDYYFNDKKSFSLSYHLFRKKFKSMTEEVFRHPGSAVYACDKIRDKYNDFFNLNGETIYFNSSVKRKAFSPINQKCPNIVYFGNVRLGRNRSLCEFADALRKIDSSYKLQVYTNDEDEEYTSMLKRHSNIFFGGSVPYDLVKQKISECDIYVVVESFLEENINYTRYSLSTKAADGLSSGSTVVAYGPVESGLIDYLTTTHAAAVCTSKNGLVELLTHVIFDGNYQEELYEKSLIVSKNNHTVEGSSRTFHSVVKKAFEREMIC